MINKVCQKEAVCLGKRTGRLLGMHSSNGMTSLLFGLEFEVLSIEFPPEALDVVEPILIHGSLIEAAAVGKAPLEVVIDGQDAPDKHLHCSVDGDDDEDPLAVAQRSGP